MENSRGCFEFTDLGSGDTSGHFQLLPKCLLQNVLMKNHLIYIHTHIYSQIGTRIIKIHLYLYKCNLYQYIYIYTGLCVCVLPFLAFVLC